MISFFDLGVDKHWATAGIFLCDLSHRPRAAVSSELEISSKPHKY